MQNHYAHSLEGRPESEWEPLEVHLREVEEGARAFAEAFCGGEWAAAAGRWHDLGKYSQEFQQYIRGVQADGHQAEANGRVNHSSAGAQHAAEKLPGVVGKMLAALVAGHHAGLPNFIGADGGPNLEKRLLDRKIPDWSAAPAAFKETPGEFKLPSFWPKEPNPAVFAFRYAFFGRLLFSALVDADFLATEAFCSPDRSASRGKPRPTLRDLAPILRARLEKLATGSAEGEVHRCRQEVLAACRAAASQPPGHFSLTVPTGGGKTLAALAFAIEHALAHGLERVVVAIPFTSIIEQTAAVFRDVFKELGEEVVLEHHSMVDPTRESTSSRLAAENWDAPLVVTTNVQLFESLFAARTSRCRKLHRLAKSVIVLDEAQTLPPTHLAPCLATLREMAVVARSTLVYCTATQPAIERRDGFKIGLEGVREIIPNREELYSRMRRVEVEVLGPLDDERLVKELRSRKQVLCIVSSRPHAARLYERLCEGGGAKGVFHLSTWMCGAHRSQVFAEIRKRLKEEKTCRVVSTQLIEAGVDVDFPTVFRALAGIDSIAQAAGRCNREGRRPLAASKTYVFEPTEVKLHGLLAETARRAREVIDLGIFPDLLAPPAIEKYFRLYYWTQQAASGWDGPKVMEQFKALGSPEYQTAAERFKLIEETGNSVTIPWGEGEKLVDELRPDFVEPSKLRKLRRQLQRYQVPVFDRQFDELRQAGRLTMMHEEWAVLEGARGYDERLGLRLDAEPEALIC